MTGCDRYMEMISALVDGELNADDEHELREHIVRCPDCAALYAFYRETSLALEEDLAEPPAALRQGVMEAVHRSARKRRRSIGRYAGYLAAAACFVVIVAVAPRLPGLGCGGSGKNASAPMAPMPAPSSAPAVAESSVPNWDAGAADGVEAPAAEEYDLYSSGTDEAPAAGMAAPEEAEFIPTEDAPMQAEPAPAESASAERAEPAVEDSLETASAAPVRDERLAMYYSVVIVRGTLPEQLLHAEFSERELGVVTEISPATAEELGRLGYEVQYYSEDSEISLVIWES